MIRPREIEILNQIIQDPTIDGLIMTTPQAGAYDDIVRAAEKNGIPIATTNSFDGGIYNRNGLSHTGQDASAAAIAGEALAKCLMDKGVEKGSIILPSERRWAISKSTTASPRPTTPSSRALKAAGKLDSFKVDAGPESVGVAADMNDPVNTIVSLIESRGDVVGAFAGQQRLYACVGQGDRAD